MEERHESSLPTPGSVEYEKLREYGGLRAEHIDMDTSCMEVHHTVLNLSMKGQKVFAPWQVY